MFKKLNELKKEYEILSMEFDNYKRSMETVASLLPAVVDFNTMKVVSIERLIRDNRHVTVLGYISPTCAELQEWALYCSEDNHLMLVKQFKQYISENN